MASSSSIKLVCIFFILSIVVPSFAKEYVVGGRKGWSPGVDYHHWAYGKSFGVGDVLREYCLTTVFYTNNDTYLF